MKSDHFKVKQPCDFTKRSESSKQSILSPAEVEDLCFRSLASRAVHHRGGVAAFLPRYNSSPSSNNRTCCSDQWRIRYAVMWRDGGRIKGALRLGAMIELQLGDAERAELPGLEVRSGLGIVADWVTVCLSLTCCLSRQHDPTGPLNSQMPKLTWPE